MKVLDFNSEAASLQALTGLEVEKVLDVILGKKGRDSFYVRLNRYNLLNTKSNLSHDEVIEQDKLNSGMIFLFGQSGILTVSAIYLAGAYRNDIVLKHLANFTGGPPHLKAALREVRVMERFLSHNLPDVSNVELNCREAKSIAKSLLKSMEGLVRLTTLVDGTGMFIKELWKSFGLETAGGLVDVYHKFMLGDMPWRDLIASSAEFIFERGGEFKLVKAGQELAATLVEAETVNLEAMMWELSENLMGSVSVGKGPSVSEISESENVLERFSELIKSESLDAQSRFAVISLVWWLITVALSARLKEISEASLKKVGEIMQRK